MGVAIIKTVRRGKRKGQFRFVLKAANGEIIASSGSESYTQKHNCVDVLNKYFPEFDIVDLTLKVK